MGDPNARPQWGLRLTQLTFAALAAWIVVAGVAQQFEASAGIAEVMFDPWAQAIARLLTIIVALLGFRRWTGDRRGLRLVAASVVLWCLGEFWWYANYWTDDFVAAPNPADIGYFGHAVCLALGFWLLRRDQFPQSTPVIRADIAIAALSIFAFTAAVVHNEIADAASGTNALHTAFNLIYPAAGALALGLVAAAAASGGWRLDRTWSLLAVGAGLFWLADTMYLIVEVTAVPSLSWTQNAAWWMGLVVLAAATWVPPQRAVRRQRLAPARGARTLLAPLAFSMVSLGLLVAGNSITIGPAAVLLACAALLAVMVRLMLTFRLHAQLLSTSQAQAATDPLTGLANRRVLEADLGRALRECRAGDASFAVALFDLNGFKTYNDTFGHSAGDALLVSMARRMQEELRGAGTAYRIGGDEFCALIRLADGPAGDLVERAAGALCSERDGQAVSAAHGTILLPLEADNVDAALELADERMYRHKAARRVPVAAQAGDALARALAERDPQLDAHHAAVAGLAEQISTRLGITGTELEHLRRAAELHDIGMLALSDALREKSTALTADDLACIREHPVIGARILGAVPALQPVAHIVRSTHERWDGTGYPDGLRGEEIPLAARVIAVAEALDEMTTQRPYGAVQTWRAALAEVRACSGQQFDPAVVEIVSRMPAPDGHR